MVQSYDLQRTPFGVPKTTISQCQVDKFWISFDVALIGCFEAIGTTFCLVFHNPKR
jgi:hypothetical protein